MICLLASAVDAQSVLLVRPSQEEPMLLDAFHRLEAELHIHDFETQVVDAGLDGEASSRLAALAEERHALAAIALLRRDGQTALDLWLVNRVTGEATLRTLDAGTGNDAPSLIAVRAVDLLRASLGEFDPNAPPARDAQNKPDEPVSPVAPQLTAADEPDWWLYATGCTLHSGTNFGFSYGPALELFYRPTSWLHTGISLAAPLTATTLHTANGSASVRQEYAAFEARFPIVRAGRFSAGPLLAAGAYFLQANGHATAPLVSRDDDVWSFLFAVGAHAELALFTRVSASLSVRALALVPRLGVAVGPSSSRIEMPAFEAAAGIAVGL